MFVKGFENGYYLSPCVMSEIRPQMEIYKKEVFGAVLLIIPFDDEEVIKNKFFYCYLQ